MARMIPRAIAQWIKEASDSESGDSERTMQLLLRDGDFVVRLTGIGRDGRRHMMYSDIDESESGISGGGSVPDGWQRAINKWSAAAGF
jgi:hypothetical protein